MRILFSIVSFVGLISGVWAETPSRTDEQLFAALSERTNIKVESTEFFRVASASDAWTVFAFLNFHLPNDGKELLKKAGRAIAENPGIEKYVTEGMAKLPHHFSNDDKRTDYLAPLGYVPAPWSLRLLGHYLVDETPMIYPEHVPDDYGAATNPQHATGALMQMGFSDEPNIGYILIGGQKMLNITPDVEKAWRNWWKANEGRVEQRIAEVNPSYYRPMPIATPVPPTPTPQQVASFSAPKPTIKPTASLTPLPAPIVHPRRANDWLLFVGAGLALVVLGAVLITRLLNGKGD